MSSSAFSKARRANSNGRIEVTVHTDFEQHTTTQKNDNESYDSPNEQVHGKSDAWGLDKDVERDM